MVKQSHLANLKVVSKEHPNTLSGVVVGDVGERNELPSVSNVLHQQLERLENNSLEDHRHGLGEQSKRRANHLSAKCVRNKGHFACGCEREQEVRERLALIAKSQAIEVQLQTEAHE